MPAFPYCHHCRKDEAGHAEGQKCLYGPTSYEPVIVAHEWQKDGSEAVWTCPHCKEENTLTGLNPEDVFEHPGICTKCNKSLRVCA